MKNKYTLVGVDGNAFIIMAYVKTAMKNCGFSQKEISDYLERATSSDYNNLIIESMNMIDECNNR